MKQYEGRPFVLLGVNSDRNPDTPLRLYRAGTITWNNWVDGGTTGPITSRWGVEAWPSSFLIDHRGVVRSHARGDRRDVELKKLVEEAEQGL